ncbi:hypothetical protein DFH11DRAFT_1587738 [Phellopilus nigrolimitatus]|nr:hypothetical protein DFH11DRAFT_1587738 [Phellopilus nigrolimitatus]
MSATSIKRVSTNFIKKSDLTKAGLVDSFEAFNLAGSTSPSIKGLYHSPVHRHDPHHPLSRLSPLNPFRVGQFLQLAPAYSCIRRKSQLETTSESPLHWSKGRIPSESRAVGRATLVSKGFLGKGHWQRVPHAIPKAVTFVEWHENVMLLQSGSKATSPHASRGRGHPAQSLGGRRLVQVLCRSNDTASAHGIQSTRSDSNKRYPNHYCARHDTTKDIQNTAINTTYLSTTVRTASE